MPGSVDDRPDVFIRDASAGRERVLPNDRLEAAGVRVINDAIEGSVALLLFASSASLASRNVKHEPALGWRYEKVYLPLLIGPVTILGELAYWLEGSQWIEVLDRPESDWLSDIAKSQQLYAIDMTPDDQLQPRVLQEQPLLVGREREREQVALRDHLERIQTGYGSVVLVSGEGGIDKTTWVGDLSSGAEERCHR